MGNEFIKKNNIIYFNINPLFYNTLDIKKKVIDFNLLFNLFFKKNYKKNINVGNLILPLKKNNNGLYFYGAIKKNLNFKKKLEKNDFYFDNFITFFNKSDYLKKSFSFDFFYNNNFYNNNFSNYFKYNINWPGEKYILYKKLPIFFYKNKEFYSPIKNYKFYKIFRNTKQFLNYPNFKIKLFNDSNKKLLQKRTELLDYFSLMFYNNQEYFYNNIIFDTLLKKKIIFQV